MSGPLVYALLSTAFFLLFILLTGPILLRYLARTNSRRRGRLVRDIRRLEQGIGAIRQELRPFETTQAPQYRQIYQAVAGRVEQVAASRRGALSAGRMYFPQVQGGMWPLNHFLYRPQDVGQILTTTWRLRQSSRVLEEGQAALAEAQRDIEGLIQMPATLKRECRQVLDRLRKVEQVLRVELAAGMAVAEELEARRRRVADIAADLSLSLEEGEGLPLAESDRIGRSLADITPEMAELSYQAAAMRQERLTFDQKFDLVSAGLDDFQRRLDPAAVPDAVVALWRTGDRALGEAWRLRGSGVFHPALTLLENVGRMTEVGNALLGASKEVKELGRLEEEHLDPEIIGEVRDHLQTVLTVLERHLEEVSRTQSGTTPTEGTQADFARVMEGIAKRIKEIRAEAVRWDAQFQADVQEQERRAILSLKRLDGAWQSLQKVLPLSRGERLVREYQTITRRYEVARGRPRTLQRFIGIADELAQDVEETSRFLEQRFGAVAGLTASFPDLVSRVEATAGRWTCLQSQVLSIKEDAAAVQQIWQDLPRTGWLQETYELLDEVKIRNLRAQEVVGDIDGWAERLNSLSVTIQNTLDVIEETIEEVERPRIARLLSLVEMHTDRALGAPSCEDALESLRQAEKLANQLAIMI